MSTELDEFIKFQYKTFEHFQNTVKEHDGNEKIRKDLSSKMFMLNRIIHLAEIIKKELKNLTETSK